MTNNMKDSSVPQVMPISERAYNEFFEKEIAHTIKPKPFNMKFLGLFFENGDEAQKKRKLFSKFF